MKIHGIGILGILGLLLVFVPPIFTEPSLAPATNLRVIGLSSIATSTGSSYGSVALFWNSMVSYTNVAFLKIYKGPKSGQYTESIIVPNITLTTNGNIYIAPSANGDLYQGCVFTNILADNEYHFVGTCMDVYGNEGPPSNETVLGTGWWH